MLTNGSNMKNKEMVLIGISKLDNGMIRYKIRKAGAYMITNYQDGLNYVLAPIEKAKEALNLLFPYHQLMKIEKLMHHPQYYFDNGIDRIKINQQQFEELNETLNQL